MATPTIKTADTSDEASTINELVLAFGADPAARWVWPDQQQFLMHFPSFVRAFGGKAFTHGSAYYVDVYAGALNVVVERPTALLAGVEKWKHQMLAGKNAVIGLAQSRAEKSPCSMPCSWRYIGL